MKISVAAAMSADGKLTRHDETNIYEWVSDEDQQHFRALIAAHRVIVMGRGSYEAVQDSLRLEPRRLRVVLTSDPGQFADRAVDGSLEFSNESVRELSARLEAEGYQNMLVVGDPRMITDFLQAGLVDHVYLTIEPRLFGRGKPLLNDMPADTQLRLNEYRQLNAQGTLLVVYEARKE